MTTELMTLEVRNRQQWRTWLGKHHASSPGVWLVFYKDHTGVKSIPYEDTVREALCFGWIDSLIKRLDDDRYRMLQTSIVTCTFRNPASVKENGERIIAPAPGPTCRSSAPAIVT